MVVFPAPVEPTKAIDVYKRQSYDHQFIQTVANRIIELLPQGCFDKAMTYDEFLEWKGQPAD